MYNGLAKNLSDVFKYCKEKINLKNLDIQTFEMPKILENKKIHSLEIIEYIYNC